MKNLTQEDFLSGKVDLHIHSNYSDGKADFKEIIERAKKNGYKMISITDHNTVEGHRKYQDNILLTGAEFDCWFGYVYIHLLAYRINVSHPSLYPFLAKTNAETKVDFRRLFAKRNVPKLIKAIHEAGGIAVLAHPACYWALNLEKLVKKLMKHGLDGIEVYYPYPRFRKIVKFHSAKDVKKIANKYPQLIQTGGTDFHDENFS